MQDYEFQLIMKTRAIDNSRKEEFPRPAMEKINKLLGNDGKKGGKFKKS